MENPDCRMVSKMRSSQATLGSLRESSASLFARSCLRGCASWMGDIATAIAEPLTRVIAAIGITSACLRSSLHPRACSEIDPYRLCFR